METVERQEAFRKLRALIHAQKVAMLTTVEEDGSLRARPMWTQDAEPDGKLWFMTYADSAKTHELEHDGHVNVAYVDPDSDTYVSVSGLATLVRDPDRARRLWRPLYRAWFPNGPEDPNLTFLRVEVQRAEYWDQGSRRMVQLFGYLKALFTGHRHLPGGHAELDFH